MQLNSIFRYGKYEVCILRHRKYVFGRVELRGGGEDLAWVRSGTIEGSLRQIQSPKSGVQHGPPPVCTRKITLTGRSVGPALTYGMGQMFPPPQGESGGCHSTNRMQQ